MKIFQVVRLFFFILLILSYQVATANEHINAVNLITENITKVCDKPDHAGNYWDIKVKGSGEAGIRLKLLGLGKITGESTFSKGEWEGVQRTVEDSKDYRYCVEKLTPIFLEKFIPLIPAGEGKKKRVLGGIKWQEFRGGVNLTLTSCFGKSSSVVCEFIANSSQQDVKININGSSAIYDQSGNKYFSTFVSIANWSGSLDGKGYGELRAELTKGVDTKVLVHFDIDKDVSLITKAFLGVYIDSDWHPFTFRDVSMNVQ